MQITKYFLFNLDHSNYDIEDLASSPVSVELQNIFCNFLPQLYPWLKIPSVKKGPEDLSSVASSLLFWQTCDKSPIMTLLPFNVHITPLKRDFLFLS